MRLCWAGGRLHTYWGALKPSRIPAPHQCLGAQSSIPSNSGIHKESNISTRAHSPTHRQYNGGGVCQSEGWDTLTIPISSCSRPLVLCSQDVILGDSNSYPRSTQQGSRHCFSSLQPQAEVELGLQRVSEDRGSLLSSRRGSV